MPVSVIQLLMFSIRLRIVKFIKTCRHRFKHEMSLIRAGIGRLPTDSKSAEQLLFWCTIA